MTFQPVVPFGGYSGWVFLNRTLENQKQAFEESSVLQREEAYFRENIGQVQSAEDLVSDRRLLQVALGAFGLEDDINNTYFIKKVLEDGTLDNDALANRLSDKRYSAFSEAFGFGNLGGAGRVGFDGFSNDILTRYKQSSFELAVGEQNQDMRLAMNIGSNLADVLGGASTEDGKWFSIMGNTPVRTVFETALGFSSSIGTLDIDLQLSNFKERAESVFGTSNPDDFLNPEKQDDLIRMFLVRSEANNGAASSSAQTALVLLQSAF
jgi:hypothetical protein